MERMYVVRAEDKGSLHIQVTFNDGHQSLVDIGEFIRQHPHPQYNKYIDPQEFAKFQIEHGNVVWGEDWDLIFPVEHLYVGKVA